MLTMIAKMSAITALYVILNFFMWSILRNRKMTWGLRVLIGIIFGAASVLSTHFGVRYDDMVLNVRDLGPMSAGLFFDPIAGIIAGLIGGIERYIVGTYFGIGSFTRIACSVSTCFAGFLAAFMSIYIFNRKKPSAPYAFFMGAVIEVFHMYVVFITHRDDMDMAFMVVETCAIPMITFSAIGLGLSAELFKAKSGDRRPFLIKSSSDKIPVSQRFQAWLFVVTTAVLITSFIFNYNLQTRSTLQDSKEDLAVASLDVQEEYSKLRKYDVDLSEMTGHVGSHGVYTIHDEAGKVAVGDLSDEKEAKAAEKIYIKGKDKTDYSARFRGEKWLVNKTVMPDGYGVLVMLPYSEVFHYRDMQAYETMLADILLFTVIFVLITLLVQTIVVDNLTLVNKSLAKITGGDFNEQVAVYNSTEFASLSDDINAMVLALKGYIAAAEKRIEQELLLAHTIQESALPTNFDFQHGGFEIFALMDPAKEVGGDFYDFFFVDTDKLAMVIADVSGKGIPAALFMMHSKTAIRSLAETGTDIEELFARVNDELCEGNQAEMFVTVWMAIIDLNTGLCTCVNAGHEYSALMRKGKDYELFMDKHKLPLGCMTGMKYESYELDLDPGDCIYVYTDGIPEAINTDEEQYGTDRMIDVLNENKQSSIKDTLKAVKVSVDKFAGEAEQFDDQTMMGFRYFGKDAGKDK